MQQSRPERLTTFSSHAMAFAPLAEIGFWQTNVVSEDSRIFWQCFLHFDGDWRTVPLFYPVSMDANVAPSFWKTMVNQYKQQRRWGYGVENIPYMLSDFPKTKNSFPQKLYFGFNGLEGFHSWATNALIVFLSAGCRLFWEATHSKPRCFLIICRRSPASSCFWRRRESPARRF